MRNKRRLLNAMDFQSLMYPCFIFCRMLGIFPYKIHNSTFIASKPHYILSIVIVCVFCVLDLILIHDIITLKIKFESVIRKLECIIYFTLSGFMVVSTHILNGPRMRLLQTILEISSKFPQESYQKMSRFVHVKDIIGVVFKSTQLFIYFSKIQKIDVSYKTVLLIVFAFYCGLLILQINMLYINCVYILKACFKRINDNLAYIQKLMINDVTPALNLICLMQRNQFLLIELKTLKKQHLMISDTMKMLNIIFSLQLLITILIVFSTTTFELYFYIIQWQDVGMLFGTNKQFLGTFLIRIAYYIIKITLLVWICETVKIQVQKTRITIHDLLNSTNDEQIKYEVIM